MTLEKDQMNYILQHVICFHGGGLDIFVKMSYASLLGHSEVRHVDI